MELTDLRTVQHPYLIDQDLEPSKLSEADSHKCLVEASGKLAFLKIMLNKLKARGHRVLLFSQVHIMRAVCSSRLIHESPSLLSASISSKTSWLQKATSSCAWSVLVIFLFYISYMRI